MNETDLFGWVSVVSWVGLAFCTALLAASLIGWLIVTNHSVIDESQKAQAIRDRLWQMFVASLAAVALLSLATVVVRAVGPA